MNDLNKIKNIAEKITLLREEKENIKTNLLDFIKSSPVAVKSTNGIFSKALFSRLFNLKFAPAFAGILLILAVSGGVSLAAEKAVPGDLLYPVKVGINEEVRAAVSFSVEAKTHWDTRRLERRLEEAEKLALKKEFSAEARSKVEANFDVYAERVERRIAEFEEKGNVQKAADLSLNFEVSLDAHEKTLEKLDGEEVNKFLPKVKGKKDSAKLFRIKSEAKVLEKSRKEEDKRKKR